MKEPHPWENFLKARYFAMVWMRDVRKLTNSEIAERISIDTEQVGEIFDFAKNFPEFLRDL